MCSTCQSKRIVAGVIGNSPSGGGAFISITVAE
jgi:hypothetical protein